MWGLIPAHAGKTFHLFGFDSTHWAHPRSRGENTGDASACRPQVGSSPLTRGKRVASPRTHGRSGLIPAHAGKTRGKWDWRPSWRAHPRSRGENKADDAVAVCELGSSPLTRGKRPVVCGGAWRLGLIPAHAGKTPTSIPVSWHTWAHPRSRGENHHLTACAAKYPGSSPLTRGKHLRVVCAVL